MGAEEISGRSTKKVESFQFSSLQWNQFIAKRGLRTAEDPRSLSCRLCLFAFCKCLRPTVLIHSSYHHLHKSIVIFLLIFRLPIDIFLILYILLLLLLILLHSLQSPPPLLLLFLLLLLLLLFTLFAYSRILLPSPLSPPRNHFKIICNHPVMIIAISSSLLPSAA